MTRILDERTLALLVAAVADTFLREREQRHENARAAACENVALPIGNMWKWSCHFPVMPSSWNVGKQARLQ